MTLEHHGVANRSPEPGPAMPAARRPIDCGDLGLKITRDGTWLYHGSPIGRLPLVKLFASVLRREEEGYYLVTPAERGRIEVEDVPFLAVELEARGAGPGQELAFRTNLDAWVTADGEHPLRIGERADGEPQPYLLVQNGLEARLTRPVFYQLVELGEERPDGTYGVWSRNRFFPLGTLAR